MRLGLIDYVGWWWHYFRLRRGWSVLRDIKILSIEFSSVCNLRCKYCFLEQKDRARFLDIAVYEKLIKEVAENPAYRIRTMEWPISGEFFVYKDFKRVVEITRHYWKANPRFRPHIILNENLVLLDAEKIDLILQSGIVRQVICSVDGHDEESFEDMRPPAKFERMKTNFEMLVRRNRELGKPVHIQINNGRDERSFGKPYSREMIGILDKGDDLTVWFPKFWNESFNRRESRFYPAKGFCSFVFNNVTLTASGQVSKCCMDLKGATAYADLNNNTLEDIWHSPKRREFLQLMSENKRHLIPGCNTCSLTSVNNDNRYNSWQRRIKRLLLPLKRYRYKKIQPRSEYASR